MNTNVFATTQVVASSSRPFEQVIQAIEARIGQMPIERLAQPWKARRTGRHLPKG